MENIYNSLNNGGVIVLTTPNVIAPRNRINVLLGRDVWFNDKYHIHFFSPRMLGEALERNGFSKIRLVSKGKISFLGPSFGGTLMAVAEK